MIKRFDQRQSHTVHSIQEVRVSYLIQSVECLQAADRALGG